VLSVAVMRRLLPLVALIAVTAGLLGGVSAVPDPTFSRDIAPIFQRHCQECHRPGGGAPFQLLTYDQVYRRREKILETTRTRAMPPWKPVAGYGDFLGVRGLTKDEIALIGRWVETGAPEGDPADLPPRAAFESAPSRGTPDLVLRSEPFTVPSRSGDVYRCFSTPTTFAEDRYFTVTEVVPGNSRIVHHMLAMVDAGGASAHIRPSDLSPGYPCFGGPRVRIDGYLGGWTPGSRPWIMPEGVGIRLPAGARVVIQMHYHNGGPTAESDRTEIRLHTAATPIVKELRFARVGSFTFTIPAGAQHHEIEASMFVHRSMSLIAIHPHMHLLGREMKAWAKLPDQSSQPLVHIDDWDFNWQGFYFYRTPVGLPRGAWIELTAAWDNSERNARNPNRPPQLVRWGERTVDEMGHAAILYTFDDEKIDHRPR
jgi:hypothetical protein